MGGSKPDNVHDYDYNDPETCYFYRGSRYDPELTEFKRFLIMTQKTIISLNENFSKLPKKNCTTNKTDVYHIDDIWSLDILNLKGYGSKIIVNLDRFW